MKRYNFIILLSLLSMIMLQAQQSPKERIYQAFVYDRMDDWESVISEQKSLRNSLSDAQLGELINFYYGFSGWLMEEGPEKKAKQYIEEADEIIDELLAKYPRESDWYAFKAAFYAYKLNINPIKAPFLGGKSMDNIDLALKYGPEKSQAWIERGNALFYMPKAFGGSKEEALVAYKKAVSILEKDPEALQHNWIYLNVLMILGQSYEKTGHMEEAKSTYEKLLRIEPDFSIMKNELYPAFLKTYVAQQEEAGL